VIGRQFGHYRILAPLAAGGMGEVFRALDTHLDREVAIKLLPVDTFADPHARRRMRDEALSLSRLQHPHIAVIHDFAEQDGIPFLVMELIDGETLAHRLERGALPEPEVRRIGAEIADALAAAHERGIVHRDLKPANVMITSRGAVKVVDFGIARRTPEGGTAATTITATAGIAGTLPYMAPEQLLGGRIDGRTDLFAFGAVLYEMVTGTRPFAGESSMALANAILNQAPERPSRVRPGIPADLEAVILRCLEKRATDRYASAADVAAALRTPTHPARGSPVRPRAAVLVAMIAAIAAVAGALLLPRLSGCEHDSRIRALAVLPLTNLSGDAEQEYFADGMTDELIVSLSQIRALRVISRSSSMTYKGSHKVVPEIGRELKVDALISGSIQRSGNRVRIRAQMVDARADQNLWADSFEGDLANVLELQSKIAAAIVERIHAQIEPSERSRLTAARKIDPQAHESYLRGRYYLNQFSSTGWQKAIESFQRAVSIEPTYAAAYAGLADACFYSTAGAMDPHVGLLRARPAVDRALELDPDLPAALASRGVLQGSYDRDWDAAEASFRRALTLNPNEVTALQNYGYLHHVHRRFDEARAMFERAREIDPLSPYGAAMTLWPLNQGRRYSEAIAQARSMIAADSSQPYPRFIMAQALCLSGNVSEGVQEFEWVARHDSLTLYEGWLAWAYALDGRRADAQRIRVRLEALAKTSYVHPYGMAVLELGLGNHDQAIAWLMKADEARLDEIAFINSDPAMDPLRADPRFQELIRGLRLQGPRTPPSRNGG